VATVGTTTLSVVLSAMLAAGLVALVLALAAARHQRTLSERHRGDLQHALDALLQAAGEQLGAQARSGAAHLDSRKELIDGELRRLGGTLTEVAGLVQQLETARATQLGEVSQQLQGVSLAHGELTRTAGALREALTNSQARGQWGERMAVDVLRSAGFVEGINFRTQVTTSSGSRPDVTFLLPGDQVLHMDVKFPLGRYLDMLEATNDTERDECRAAFLRAVRDRIKELDGRGYIDPSAGTLDCVLLFIPNEQVYGFVHEHDPALLDHALERKVVLCSPTTLFAVLAVIRQAVDRFALERTSDEILQLLAGFTTQWEAFLEAMERVGRGLETTQKAFDALGTTRRTKLERQLDRIEELRGRRGVPPVLVGEPAPRLVALPDETPAPRGEGARASETF
jgi:DNA recombination protein RmuC